MALSIRRLHRTYHGYAVLFALALGIAPRVLLGCGSSSSKAAAAANDAGPPTRPIVDAGAYSDGAGIAMGPGDSGANGCVHGPFPSPDIYDEKCQFDPTEYRHLASSFITNAGLSYRFGADSTYYHPTPMDLPTAPRPEEHVCAYDNSGDYSTYEIGTACTPNQPGNYSSDEAAILYQPSVVDFDAGIGGGVDNTIITQSFGYNVLSERPQAFSAPAYAENLFSSDWVALGGGPVFAPIAAARGFAPTYGQATWNAIIAFNDGVIGALGPNTAPGGYVTALPVGLVPTSIGVTNAAEFVLVTAWDTVSLTGKLAVFAAASNHNGYKDIDDDYGYDFRIDLPGFYNTGAVSNMKLLGVLDLPGIIAPTEIAVASNYQAAFFRAADNSYTAPGKLDLTQQSVWQTFTDGGVNATQRSTAGFAVISSRSERKVAFVDLQPLFDTFNAAYFTSFSTFQSNLKNEGPAPNQWPQTFDQQPAAAPVIVSTISVPEIPTAVYAGRSGNIDTTNNIHALVATMDGTLHIYQVGGLIDTTAATADAIKEIGTLAVGNNPTQIATGKKGGSTSDSNNAIHENQVFVVARGDRAVDFVKINGGSGSVYNKLQDTALLDPVAVDAADEENLSSYIISIADLEGQQVVNYRYGAVTLPIDVPDGGITTFGMGPDGGAPFELGGGYAVQGKPFAVSGTNVP